MNVSSETAEFPYATPFSLLSYLRTKDIPATEAILTAIALVERKYHDKKRASGNPVATEHIYEVTQRHLIYKLEIAPSDISTGNRLGTPLDLSSESIVSGLMHDVLEDIVGFSRTELAELFGENVLYRVGLVTNIEAEAESDYERRGLVNGHMVSVLQGLNFTDPRDWDVFTMKMSDVENGALTLPLPNNPDKEARVVRKLFEGRLSLAYDHSQHFYDSLSGQLRMLGYGERVNEFEREKESGPGAGRSLELVVN